MMRPDAADARDRARRIADELLRPNAAGFEAEEHVPASVFARLGEEGLMAMNVPSALGGSELGVVAYVHAMIEIARACAATAVTMAVTNMVGEVVARFGSDEQRAHCNPVLARGGLGAFALSEANAGSDPGAMRTSARPVPGGWVLEGTKQWISHGDRSSVVVVWARTGEGTQGIDCFLVDPATAGFDVVRCEDKMGLRASHTAALAFDRLEVPEGARLGPSGAGFRIAMMALDGGRIGIGAQALGIAEGACDVLRQAHQRTRDAALAHTLIEARIRLDAARALVLEAARAKQAGEPFSQTAAMAKALATETATRVCTEAALLGPKLASDERARVERAARDVRVTMIYEGTSEVQRVVIGRGLRAKG